MAESFLSLVLRDATREQLEDWCRSRAQAIPAGEHLVLCRVLGKHLMYVLSRDSALTPHLALSGLWEPWVSMAIARHLRPGMRCLDVGACYGYYSLLMAEAVASQGQVDAWEPYHSGLLQLNADINGLGPPRLRVHPYALGVLDAGRFVIMTPPASDGLRLFNAGGVTAHTDDRQSHSYERRVEVRAPAQPGIYDFIKVDVEGYEAEVWRALELGSVSPDARRPVTVCLEFTPSKHEDPRGFLTTIEQDGFALGTVGHDGTPRDCSMDEALQPDTDDFRMLWLTR